MQKKYVSCCYCYQYLKIDEIQDVYTCDNIKGCKNKQKIKYVNLSYLNDKSPYSYKLFEPEKNLI